MSHEHGDHAHPNDHAAADPEVALLEQAVREPHALQRQCILATAGPCSRAADSSHPRRLYSRTLSRAVPNTRL